MRMRIMILVTMITLSELRLLVKVPTLSGGTPLHSYTTSPTLAIVAPDKPWS